MNTIQVLGVAWVICLICVAAIAYNEPDIPHPNKPISADGVAASLALEWLVKDRGVTKLPKHKAHDPANYFLWVLIVQDRGEKETARLVEKYLKEPKYTFDEIR